MTLQTLERGQVLLYMLAILLGVAAAVWLPDPVRLLEGILWPVLGFLLYVTFTQVPVSHLRDAFTDTRFLGLALMGNFLLIPIVVWLLLYLLPPDPAIRVGVAMVLLLPCTDWFITFTRLGGGDAGRAIALSPLHLLLQLGLLPMYLLLFFGGDVVVTLARREMLLAFGGLILLPLFLANLTQRWAEGNARRGTLLERAAWLPVPLLALVVFIIAATQSGVLAGFREQLPPVLLVFAAFLVAAAGMARLVAAVGGLLPAHGRVLAFSFGTRNSFVVLPLALALPASWELAAVVIVFQSIVELVGMTLYLWVVPRRLFPMR